MEEVRTEEATREMYNLTVDDAHTFYVGDGQWLVHNGCKWLGSGKPPAWGEDMAQMADDVYTRLSQDVMDNSTLGLTQIEGKTYVTITGRVNFHKQALNELKKVAFDLGINFVDNPGRIHAEKLLYYEYNMDQAFKGIGISNRRGPCPTCESFFKEEVLFDRVFWTGLYK